MIFEIFVNVVKGNYNFDLNVFNIFKSLNLVN